MQEPLLIGSEIQEGSSFPWHLLMEATVFLWKDWPKEMLITPLDMDNNFSLNGKCPHCKRESVFIRVSAPHWEGLSNGWVRVAAVMKCQGCLKLILGLARHFPRTEEYRYEMHYPVNTPDDSVAAEIPEAIRSDFQEALRCLSVNAFNATAEMCRRAVEASCTDLGAPRSERFLEDKIDYLEAQRKITPFLRDVAHKIRLGGNRAAHPGNVQSATTPPATAPAAATAPVIPPEPPITEEQANAIVTFTREFFHHVYVVPKQLDKYDFSKPKAATGSATAAASGSAPGANPAKKP